jgi:hypothetical protein
MFVGPCIIVQFIKKIQDATVYPNFIIPYLYEVQHVTGNTAHHQEPKTALAASGFVYMDGTVLCLTASTSYTPNNLPRMKTQRLPVQFKAPDDGRCVAQNMLSFI